MEDCNLSLWPGYVVRHTLPFLNILTKCLWAEATSVSKKLIRGWEYKAMVAALCIAICSSQCKCVVEIWHQVKGTWRSIDCLQNNKDKKQYMYNLRWSFECQGCLRWTGHPAPGPVCQQEKARFLAKCVAQCMLCSLVADNSLWSLSSIRQSY